MLLNLTTISAEPLHQQISRQIREQILSGDLAEGRDLPSIRVLAAEQQVSVITVQRAYQDLEREGVIYTRRGIGIFVASLSDAQRRQIAAQRLRQRAAPVIAEALAAGLTPAQVQEIVEESFSLKGAAR